MNQNISGKTHFIGHFVNLNQKYTGVPINCTTFEIQVYVSRENDQKNILNGTKATTKIKQRIRKNIPKIVNVYVNQFI